MSLLPAPLEPVRPAFLTRVSPVARLVAGLVWFATVLSGLDPLVPARIALAALIAIVLFSGLPLRRIPTRLAPLWVGLASLTLFSILFASVNGDPARAAALQAGPVRITWDGVAGGLAIGLRVVVVALTTLLVFATSDLTRFADSLVQQWRVPDRFAYGTLAALRAAPAMAADWSAIGASRKLRGLRPRGLRGRIREGVGRLLVLLVSAVRRAERLALAMDARGFDAGIRRSHYREVRSGWRDWVTIGVAVGVALAALFVAR